jgi:hypothetical protein
MSEETKARFTSEEAFVEPFDTTEEAISFRQIHEPSGTPIKQVKGVRDGELSPKVP